ncbi:DUF4145 domain-containing protein [Colwellia sp. Arc7-D]|uniref:DUF4145 domain-containing protein n=1 Tax=Colwellia sp. Arc7-D TaxID=2161872 RepID=UPI000D3DA542|nr:DUF4145 domain-containing protein [Colwellia sp. Arc7-D]AWB58205.1 hypothetical protein DBO93_11930 [Colwellia sp. Arc7-D]
MIESDNDLAKWFSEEIFVEFNEAKVYQSCLPEFSLVKIRTGVELLIDYLYGDYDSGSNNLLFDKINQLHKSNIINPNITSLLHTIRKLGNTGAHKFSFTKNVDKNQSGDINKNAIQAVKTFRILLEDVYTSQSGNFINELKVVHTELNLEHYLLKVFIMGERDLQTITDLVVLLYAKASSNKTKDKFLLNRAIDIAKSSNNKCPQLSFLLGKMILDGCFNDSRLDEGLDYLRLAISLGNIDACIRFALICGEKDICVDEVKTYTDIAYEANVFDSFNLVWRVYNGSFKSVPMNMDLCIEALEKGAKGTCEWAISFNCLLAQIFTEEQYGIVDFKRAYECLNKVKLSDKKMANKIEKIVKSNFYKITENKKVKELPGFNTMLRASPVSNALSPLSNALSLVNYKHYLR